MNPIIDISGQTFDRLTVINLVKAEWKGSAWLCRCSCGNEIVSRGDHLRRGLSRSCGCIRRENLIARSKHRMCGTAEHKAWGDMKGRCLNPKNKRYADYGGRGISVCPHWLASFQDFYADMGPRPSDEHSLDRIDNDGNYEPGNCQWATRSQQAKNQRRSRRGA